MDPPVEQSPSPPTPHTQDFFPYLNCKSDGCHVVSFSQPPSIGSFDSLDFGVLCSSVPDSTCYVLEDHVFYGFGVEHATYVIIFYEYMWESKQEFLVKDGVLLSSPHALYPDIFHDYVISIPSFENPSLDVSTSDHSQNTWDVSLFI